MYYLYIKKRSKSITFKTKLVYINAIPNKKKNKEN